ncbi:transcription termination/antitermination protein NusG [Parafrankia sp. BMG5.11]|uniref:transcription termination/antitermination protein NusG n=1 Tax=Parafrankia sp. BMG5.11 TaxID=222540 RepID=UPI00103C1A0E|nr:transcription termination/antitermination NusG family protein [Parafrankia sp. BMG5.11]TCJ39564.1 transcriptional activator RfaH [Parafrankia sp. BMG5.11]
MPTSTQTEPGSSRWFAVQTRAQCEDIALRHLANQRFVTFCPRARVRRKIGRHTVDRLDPFFRGYLFTRLDLDRDPWRSINGTVGVSRLVSFGSQARPAPLPAGLVEQLAQLCDTGGELSFDDGLTAGDAVRVMTGPFADLCGVLEAAGPQERVTVLLDVMARGTRVEMSRSILARAA